MFKLIKFVLLIAGLFTVAYFTLRYFGYDINWSYFSKKQKDCQERVRVCREEFLAQGYENPNCQIKDCVIDTVENSNQFIIKLKK
jgi:uncharacterized membrane protein (Fun14 family)